MNLGTDAAPTGAEASNSSYDVPRIAPLVPLAARGEASFTSRYHSRAATVDGLERVVAGLPAANVVIGDQRAQERLEFFEGLLELHDAFWASLADECAERRELERRGEVTEPRRPKIGTRWSRQRPPMMVAVSPGRPGAERDVRDRDRDWDRDDALRTIPAEVYVEALTRERVPRNGMILCPLPGHDERTPSFHAWLDRFYCHGCHRGGDIYNLAANLWGLDTRRDFPELRRRLAGELLRAAA